MNAADIAFIIRQIDSVQSAFPDIPRLLIATVIKTYKLTHVYRANIHFDLLRTGSVDVTVNKLLERGFLDAVRANGPIITSHHELRTGL